MVFLDLAAQPHDLRTDQRFRRQVSYRQVCYKISDWRRTPLPLSLAGYQQKTPRRFSCLLKPLFTRFGFRLPAALYFLYVFCFFEIRDPPLMQ